MDPVAERLAVGISPDNPAGENLEDTQLLASFDGYRVFGQMAPPGVDTDWRDIRDKALEGLGQSRDLRLLAHLGAAALRTQGLAGFCDVLGVASRWFEGFPDKLYPLVDEDAILRRNALNCFADRMAIVEAVRRQPLVVNAQLGSFSLRHFEIATGTQPATESDGEPPSAAHVSAALSEAPDDQIAPLAASLEAGVAALRHVDGAMRGTSGTEGAPTFDALLTALEQARKILADELATRAANAAPADGSADGEVVGAGGAIAIGSIRSRDDAIRALDAVATFFRKNEPSSPVPIFIERAKRLVAKDFLEVLADVAPDGLDQAKRVGGIRDE
jgi:type VI secretion system protein ImpA